MGEMDVAEKILESYNDVFADIVNVLLFNGKSVFGCLNQIVTCPYYFLMCFCIFAGLSFFLVS